MFGNSSRYLTIALACGSILVASCDNSGKEEAGATAATQPPAVTVSKVKSTDIRFNLAFTGRIEAIDKVDLRARIPGFLEERQFTEGKDVKKGDLLFVIEKGPYEAAVAEAEAVVQSSQAAVKRAQIEYDRQATLVKQDVASKAKLDDATVKRDESRANLLQSQAALVKAKLNLGYTEIRAPLDGRIGRAEYSIGNFVEPSSGSLATIVSQDPVYVTFPITQREVLELRKQLGSNSEARNADIALQLADGSRYEHQGKVDFVDVTANQGTDTVLVRAIFPNPDTLLVDGQLVTVIAEAGKPRPVMSIQQSAIQFDQAGTYVLVVDKDNKIEVRRIEVGPVMDANIAVMKGLAEDDRIVTQGIQKVRPGQVVEPTESD